MLALLGSLLKRVLPRKLWAGLITPVGFRLLTGHLRSCLASISVNRRGIPLPWYTYPAIDFLETKDFSASSILEFGAGNSTLWWARRAKRVISLESDPKWERYVRTRAPGKVHVCLVPDDLAGLDDRLQGEKFHLIIIDGLDRVKAALRSLDFIAPDGAIILDNSCDPYGASGAKEYVILQMFRSRKYCRVDFYGYAPGLTSPNCTSLFFTELSVVVHGNDNVVLGKFPEG